jgi:hypothetical protein
MFSLMLWPNKPIVIIIHSINVTSKELLTVKLLTTGVLKLKCLLQNMTVTIQITFQSLKQFYHSYFLKLTLLRLSYSRKLSFCSSDVTFCDADSDGRQKKNDETKSRTFSLPHLKIQPYHHFTKHIETLKIIYWLFNVQTSNFQTDEIH